MHLPDSRAVLGGTKATLLAIFGPTGVGKTQVSVELAELLTLSGEEPVAVNCDSIQVYRGLEVLSGAPTPEQKAILEHRLTGFVPLQEEFSAGRYAELAHREIDELIESGSQPILVGGTGLYLRSALSNLDLRPPVPTEVRAGVEAEIRAVGALEMHRRLPSRIRSQVHQNDNKRIARYTELLRVGEEPAATEGYGGRLWSTPARHPTLLLGIVAGQEELDARIRARVTEMVAGGVQDEVRRAASNSISRTARSAIGFEEFLGGDIEAAERSQRALSRRQMTWMRKMDGVQMIERHGRSPQELALEIMGMLERWQG